MKIFSFLIVLKIVSSSVSDLLTDNNDIDTDSLLLEKRALPSEFDKEPRFEMSRPDKNCNES